MLAFRFQINEESVKSFFQEDTDPALVNRIEGVLELYWGETLFFADENISLLELGLQVEHWLIRTQPGNQKDFHYHCVDWEDDEGFILEFLHRESDMWVVNSIWKKTDDGICVPWHELRNATAEFTGRLRTELTERFSVNWDACLKYEIKNRVFLLRGE